MVLFLPLKSHRIPPQPKPQMQPETHTPQPGSWPSPVGPTVPFTSGVAHVILTPHPPKALPAKLGGSRVHRKPECGLLLPSCLWCPGAALLLHGASAPLCSNGLVGPLRPNISDHKCTPEAYCVRKEKNRGLRQHSRRPGWLARSGGQGERAARTLHHCY